MYNNSMINFLREAPIIHNTSSNQVLDEILKRYLGDDPIIPYDLSERKKKFPLAFKELSSYMKKYL